MQNALESLSKAELIALIGQKDMLIQQKNATIQQKDASIQEKETLIAKLQRMLFGQKRERFTQSPIQLPLDFGEHLSEQDIQQLQELITKKTEAHKEAQTKESRVLHPGRSPLPRHLSVDEIIIEPTEDTAGMVLIGQEISDSLQYMPSRFYIQRIIRPKYIR
ncbi:hypothetical protein Dfri01_68410 [Dyadobacter frigoris]|nr:transposase [Dyadobacter frigoris]GLU57380.1 hypothetical protein Dfri01_68410 [Dyadobacter frigoris]